MPSDQFSSIRPSGCYTEYTHRRIPLVHPITSKHHVPQATLSEQILTVCDAAHLGCNNIMASETYAHVTVRWRCFCYVGRHHSSSGYLRGKVFLRIVWLPRSAKCVGMKQSGPDGAISGSQWACRETFVAVVVSNLPIIHPYLRKLASAIGLDFLLSRSMKSQSHGNQQDSAGNSLGKPQSMAIQLRSMRKSSRARRNDMSTLDTAAWTSNENILPVNDDRDLLSNSTPGEIMVDQEISIRTEQATGPDAYEGGGVKSFGETKSTILAG